MPAYGELLFENFGYGIQDSEVPTFNMETGQPTGETVKVKDLIITDPAQAGVSARIRFQGDQFAEFVSKMGLAKLTIVGGSGIALPDGNGHA